jgi:hypothetical protein
MLILYIAMALAAICEVCSGVAIRKAALKTDSCFSEGVHKGERPNTPALSDAPKYRNSGTIEGLIEKSVAVIFLISTKAITAFSVSNSLAL